MKYKEDEIIKGVFFIPIETFEDERGELTELFRIDTIANIPVANLNPVMGYHSVTNGGVTRGPHEHETQTDLFVFFQGAFDLYLWDKRGNVSITRVGIDNPCMVVVPPGVVHAYKNVCGFPSVSMNFPNVLYKGWGKSQSIDEIRHENDPASKYTVPQAEKKVRKPKV